MKTVLFLTAMSVAFIIAQAPAQAAQKVRKNETYCLETSVGGNRGGGGTIIQCNYETLAQCYASKVSHADTCMLNPVLAFQQRNGQYPR